MDILLSMLKPFFIRNLRNNFDALMRFSYLQLVQKKLLKSHIDSVGKTSSLINY